MTVGGTPAQTNEFQLRLDEMDKRLHDILDVMIALSEKFDRWEAEPSRDQLCGADCPSA